MAVAWLCLFQSKPFLPQATATGIRNIIPRSVIRLLLAPMETQRPDGRPKHRFLECRLEAAGVWVCFPGASKPTSHRRGKTSGFFATRIVDMAAYGWPASGTRNRMPRLMARWGRRRAFRALQLDTFRIARP